MEGGKGRRRREGEELGKKGTRGPEGGTEGRRGEGKFAAPMSNYFLRACERLHGKTAEGPRDASCQLKSCGPSAIAELLVEI